jgi:hypothetical protein
MQMVRETQHLSLPVEMEPAPESLGRFWEQVFGGALLAVISFGAIVYSGYHGWLTGNLPTDWAYAGIGFGFLFFAFGAFVFAYGWEGGDMQKTLRLTIVICLVCLATVVALLLLLKSKGTAARAAGKLGSTAKSAEGFEPSQVIHAVASMLQSDDRDEPASYHDADRKPFQVRCDGCGASFAPTPPAAQCPFCGEAALAV